jgi:hypothetical protein
MVGPVRRLLLLRLWPFTEPALRVVAALLLPPVLDARAIFTPKGQPGHLIGLCQFRKGRTGRNRAIRLIKLMSVVGHLQTSPRGRRKSALPSKPDIAAGHRQVRFGPFADMASPRQHVSSTPESGHLDSRDGASFMGREPTFSPAPLLVRSAT